MSENAQSARIYSSVLDREETHRARQAGGHDPGQAANHLPVDRRNLNSWQKATIAAEAEDLLASIAEAAKAKQLAALKQNADDTVTQTFVERPEDNRSENKTSHQAASMFGTNRTYLNEAGSTFTVTA